MLLWSRGGLGFLNICNVVLRVNHQGKAGSKGDPESKPRLGSCQSRTIFALEFFLLSFPFSVPLLLISARFVPIGIFIIVGIGQAGVKGWGSANAM